MGDRIELTEQDLIEAILAAQAAAAGGQDGAAGVITTHELAERTGLSYDTVRAKLRKLAQAGRLEVCRVMRPTLDERSQLVPAYRLKK